MSEMYQTAVKSNGKAGTKINVETRPQTRVTEVDLENPGFGVVFSDHMYFQKFSQDQWHTPEIVPYGPVEMPPATSVLHYGQGIFEGLKAFRADDGTINIFRPDTHHNRLNNSCQRLCIPEIDYDIFMTGLEMLIELDQDWVPKKRGNALYIRPFIVATDEYLAVKVAKTYQFFIITSPVGAYYKEGINPVSLITSDEYVRAVRGGVGTVKTMGNYAASLLPAQVAQQSGFTQVLWLDAIEKKYIEEVGTMNICFYIDGVLVTPPLEGTILSGVTRDSVIQIATDWGVPVEERRISIDEVIEASENGTLQEVFGTGTAAVISPVGTIQHREKTISIHNNEIGPFAKALYDEITGIQYGEKEDRFGWLHRIR